MKRIIAFFAIVFVIIPGMLSAQTKTDAVRPYVIIEYVEGKQLTVKTPDGTEYKLSNNPSIADGTEKLYAGTTIETKAGTKVELRLYPNKSIIKLSANTTFTVAKIAGDTGTDQSSFALVQGKVRMIASKGQPDSKYEIKSQTTVCGIRGTDLLFSSEPGTEESLFVKEGLVDFYKIENGIMGMPVQVPGGSYVDALKGFVPEVFSQEQLEKAYGDMKFNKLEENTVPGNAANEEEETTKETTTTETPVVEAPKPLESETPIKEGLPQPENPLFTWLKDFLGMEIGSITINGEVYAKAVLQPTFTFGKLKTSLYLPIIYSKNMFDPNDWYKPDGNSEWSFGSDYDWSSDPLGGTQDLLNDLALKIKSLEYGDQIKDEFAIKVGNLNNFTIGHGLIMNNYANDSEFPAVRKIGVYTKLDLKSFGFELMTNNLAKPEIFGGRLFFRPIENSPLAFGISAVADLFPSSSMNEADRTSLGDPMFLGTGLDLEYAFIRSDFLSIVAFSDIAAMVPYVRTGSQAGFRYDILLSSENSLRNYGVTAGLLGNILFMDYRLEYRYFTGMFKPSFFNKGYDRTRSIDVQEYANYLADPAAFSSSPKVMGIYGEAGFNILEDKLVFNAGYLWPWSTSADLSQQLAMANDFLHLEFVIKSGLIPIIDVSGSISYDRTNFVNTIMGSYTGTEVSLFDENTVFKGELIVPVPNAPNLDIALMFGSAPEKDATGNIVYVDALSKRPNIIPIISIETRIHF